MCVFFFVVQVLCNHPKFVVVVVVVVVFVFFSVSARASIETSPEFTPNLVKRDNLNLCTFSGGCRDNLKLCTFSGGCSSFQKNVSPIQGSV